MSLKAYVKVGTLSNLGDVRYCAGMGVDMIGFQVIPGHPDYLEPSRFQEIRGWVSGPLFVAEMYGLADNNALEAILENYKPDFLEVGVKEAPLLGRYPLPYILRLLPGEKMPVLSVGPAWIITEEILEDNKIPLLFHADTTEAVIKAVNSAATKGIVFRVTSEQMSGGGVHELLAPLLELLEEE